MTTSSDDLLDDALLLRRALAITGAVNVALTLGSYGGKPQYTAAIRRWGLDSWELAHDPDPVEALRKAVQRLEDQRDLI